MSDNHDAAAAAASDAPPLTTMASAMFFGTILFATVALACLVSFGSSSSSSHNTNSSGSCDSSSLLVQAATNKRSYPLDGRSLLSIYTLLHHTSLFGFILLYAYICENHPPYPHAEKTYDRDEFFFLTFLLIFVSLFTLKSHANKNSNTPPAANATSSNGSSSNGSSSNGSNSNGSKSHSNGSVVELKKKLTNIVDDENGNIEMNGLLNEDHNLDDSKNKSAAVVVAVAAVVAPVNDLTDVLNRDQTEEWKGWMQFMFLLYHYHHAEEVYNAIRIMITCYVFMTGFGNVSFFYLKADYSAVRVLQMLWRLNFLVVFLCLTQGTTYILYYICLLHTYFFLMVYVTMRVAKHVNYDKWGIRIKLFLLACIIFIVWDVDSGIFQAVHLPFLNDSRPMLGATGGAMWEWYFRSTLDHWSTFIGMIFALNFPITSLFFRKAEAQPWLQHVAVKSLVGSAFLVATYLWTTGPFQQGKFDYNQTNAYYGCIPLMAYIYFRNLTPWLRSHYLDLLHQIGKTTLETYLMQHHIWLTSNAKSLLVIVPGWPKVNFLLVTILYVAASRRLYSLTLFLRGMLLPDDTYLCLRNLAGMACTLTFCVAVAFVLQLMQCLNLVTVAMVSIGFGYLLFQFIVSRTWAAFVASAGGRDGSSSSSQQQSDHHISRGTAVRISNSKRLAMSMGIAAVLVTGTLWHAMARTGAAKIQPLSASCQDFVQQGSWIQTDVCTEESRGQAERDYGISALGTCTPQSQSGSVWGWKSSPTSSHCRLTQRDASSLLKTIKHRNITFVGDSVLRHLYHVRAHTHLVVFFACLALL
jgi:N-acetylneuraminate 9-O-acetyltransferase